jgi:phosphoglycolate phosphatase-like HAD superfamily hydrolase
VTVRCVAFDFDGTLVDSNKIKRQAFFAVAGAWPDADRILCELLDGPSVGTRYDVLAALAARLPVTEDYRAAQAAQWVEEYTRLCEEQIAVAPEIEGAQAGVRQLHDRGMRLYINSATPEDALRRLVVRRRLLPLFDGVYGAPSSKIENLRRVCTNADCSPRQLVFVGDSDADRVAAREADCMFVLVGRGGISNLAELPGIIPL